MPTPLPDLAPWTFASLAAAMVLVWAPRVSSSRWARLFWLAPFSLALVLVQDTLVEPRGVAAIFLLVMACRFGDEAPEGAFRGFALATMLAVSVALLAHAVPGFHNPRVIDGVRLSADSAPYTKYLNLDKGMLGVLLIALHAPGRAIRAAVPGSLARAALGFAVFAALVMSLTVATGYARWDPKLPEWWRIWLFGMVFLTALPEEAFFRHVVQGGLQAWLGPSVAATWAAIAISGATFGLSHVAGGWTYVALATVAGIGYGWIYAVTRSFAAAVLAHTGLNLLHLLFFTYPALQSAVG